MIESTPHFPVVIKYTDWELSAFTTREEFMRSSGWEEIDFTDDLDCIIDTEGRCFTFDPRSRQFFNHPFRQVIAAKVLGGFLETHLKELDPELLKTLELDRMSIEQLVKIIDTIVEKP